MDKMKPKYSGPASRGFWTRVAEIQPDQAHDLIYLAGCALQDHESRVLQMIADAEKDEQHG